MLPGMAGQAAAQAGTDQQWRAKAAVGLDEAASLLSISRRNLFKWREDGTIKCRTIGGRVLVPVTEIVRLLEGEQ